MEKGITKSKRLKKEKTTGTKAKEGERVKRAQGKGLCNGKGLPKKVLEIVIKKPASQVFRVFHGIHIINKSDCLPSKQEDVCHESLYQKIPFSTVPDDARDNRMYHNDGGKY